MFSIFIKLALAPVHIWALEIYENSPSISTFFFTTVTKISFFVFLTRFCSLFQIDYGQFWFFLNFLVGFLSVFFGSLGGLKQKKIKVLLGYSSIAHMGYCLLVFNSFSVLGLEMVYFYLFTYVLSNIIIWFILLALKKIILKKKIIQKLTKSINDFVLLGKSHFFLSFCFIVAIFSLAGLPPLLGFLSKLNVFLVLFAYKFYILILFVLLCSVISTFYYIRLIKILFFENILVGSLYFFNSTKILFCCLITFFLIFLFINPTLFYLIVYKMILFENFKNKFSFFYFKKFSKNLNFNTFEINSKLYLVFELVLV